VLERFALGAALHERAHLAQFRLGYGTVVVQIKLEAGQLEDVREQQLALQARGVHSVPL
jgi:hypothetical protein